MTAEKVVNHIHPGDKPTIHNVDIEGQEAKPQSAFRQLGVLDRFLAIWIFLAMAIGIILGNFVPSTGPTLQRGKFVGVSIPIGRSSSSPRGNILQILITAQPSVYWS